jgi:hypothetical protein
MITAINNKIVDSYYKFMKNWDSESKKKLIQKLSESIDSEKTQNTDFSICFGAWKDDRSAEEIIDELRNDRVENREIN